MCERCAELEERVAWLESELGLRNRAEIEARIRRAIFVGGRQSKASGTTRLVAALYAAKGRIVTRFQLEEALPSSRGRDDSLTNLVSVYVCHARKVLGRDAIENCWGQGYRLSPVGMARVSAIVNATELGEAA